MIDAASLQAIINLIVLVAVISLLRSILAFVQDDTDRMVRRKRRK